MLRFVLSLVSAGVITVAGYAGIGHGAALAPATVSDGHQLKVIATVVAHAHRRAH